MRIAAALLLVLAGTAHADRLTVVTVGGSFAAEAQDQPDDAKQPKEFGGARLTLSWEDRTIDFPPSRGVTEASLRLVPELFAGFLGNDVTGQGLLGAGLRAEVQLATLGRPPFNIKLRAAFYLAARGEVIGAKQDAAGELMFGEAFPFHAGKMKVGFEGGIMMRRNTDPAWTDRPIGVMTMFMSWMP